MSDALLQVAPVTLIGLRLSGLFVFAPILTGVAIPPRLKVLLCGVMACGMFGLVQEGSTVRIPGDAFSFAVVAIVEVAVGTVIGLLALLPFVAVQVGGVIIGQQMGLSLATVFDPSTESESEITSELLMHLALVIFVVLGGIESMFLAVANSFKAAPIGGFVLADQARSALSIALGMIGSGMELALRISAPVLGIVLLETVASAFVMKTMPQMNIMSIGFGLKVILGLGALVLAWQAIDDSVGQHIVESGRLLFAWPVRQESAGVQHG